VYTPEVCTYLEELSSRPLIVCVLLMSVLVLASSADNLRIARADSSSAPIPELSWKEGEPFPVVAEATIFPTIAPRVSEPPAYLAHWYAGSVYLGATENKARTIYTSIEVPNLMPRSDEFYYVLVSAWDSAGSYDQIGFSNTYGTWGLTYSWTNPTATTYYYSSNAKELSLGVEYTFYITTGGGLTRFVVYQGTCDDRVLVGGVPGCALVWSLVAPTGGNYLVVQDYYAGYYGYTGY
jgi:hypothetical protein